MSEFLDIIDHALRYIANTAFGLSSRLNPLYLLAMIPLGLWIYRIQKPETGFWAWFMPRDVYAHPSTRTDIKLFFIGLLLKIAGFVNFGILRVLIIYGLTETLGRATAQPGLIGIFCLTLLTVLVSDFCVYWIHRGHHELKLIWPFHAVHHSAEVMTPMTLYRKHPIYDLLSRLTHTVIIAFVQGLILALVFGQIDLVLIGGITVFSMVFKLLGANFRHSHIWISYGQFWSHIFISPAQHQIHHSLAPQHWHKNYGEILAIWDWCFGTLYVPKSFEALEFGLSTPDGRRIEQPYPTVTDALCRPFKESAAYLALPRDNVHVEQNNS